MSGSRRTASTDPVHGFGVAAFLLLGPLAGEACAYIDPGAGNAILQLILGGVAGLIVVLRLYWQQLLSFFGLRKPGADSPPDNDR